MHANGTLDIDGNSVIEARTDSLRLIQPAWRDFTDTAATNGALGIVPRSNDGAAIRSYLNVSCRLNLP